MNYDEKISKLKQELADLEEKKLAFDELPKAKKLAILLHNTQCHSSHIDQCGWLYEETSDNGRTWVGSTHRRYLEKAEGILTMLHNVSFSVIMRVIEAVNSV
jgi:hypothetical protein